MRIAAYRPFDFLVATGLRAVVAFVLLFSARFGFDLADVVAILDAGASDSSYASCSHSVMGGSTSSRCLIWMMCTTFDFEARSTRRT